MEFFYVKNIKYDDHYCYDDGRVIRMNFINQIFFLIRVQFNSIEFIARHIFVRRTGDDQAKGIKFNRSNGYKDNMIKLSFYLFLFKTLLIMIRDSRLDSTVTVVTFNYSLIERKTIKSIYLSVSFVYVTYINCDAVC